MFNNEVRVKTRPIRPLILLAAMTSLLISGASSPAFSAEKWQQLKGEHFLVYFVDNEKFAGKVNDRAEKYYRDIAADLGYARYSEFWTWEKRVKIFIYPTHKAYLEATQRPEWSQGMADYDKKTIASYAGSQGFTENVLPHEIAHLIFRDFVGFKGEVPLWLEEGVAQWWPRDERTQDMQQKTRQLFDRNALLSLADISAFDIRNMQKILYLFDVTAKDGSPAILVLNPDQLVNIFYLEAASIIGFLKERYGNERFTRFCRELRDGKTLDQALQVAYAENFSNTKELERAWRNYLR